MENAKMNTNAALLLAAGRKSGLLAILLNLAIMGAGYAYLGMWVPAVLSLLLGMPVVIVVGLVAPPVGGLIWVLLVLGGGIAAERYNRDLATSLLEH